jgi:signal transduction histidine kinase
MAASITALDLADPRMLRTLHRASLALRRKRRQERTVSGAADKRQELVFAVCHEIGNLVAVIRLEAHLLDDEGGTLGLARAAISIDDLSARVGALLTQIRPLLDPPSPDDQGQVDPAALLAHLREALNEHGGRGVSIEVESASRLPRVVSDPERTNALLLLLALAAVESAAPSGSVRVEVKADEAGVAIDVVDDGPEDFELADWRNAAKRGRSLVLQLALAVIHPLGGTVKVARRERCTHTLLHLPLA